MKTVALIVIGIAIATSAATYARYRSFDPCEWAVQDMAEESVLPRLAVRARIKARFLVRGITDPDPYQCLDAWWEYRAEDLPGNS